MIDIVKKQIAESILVKQALLSDDALMEKVVSIARVMIDAYRGGHKTMWAGNGGSAADAQHMAGELVNKFCFDRPGLAALSLSTDTLVWLRIFLSATTMVFSSTSIFTYFPTITSLIFPS